MECIPAHEIAMGRIYYAGRVENLQSFFWYKLHVAELEGV